MRTLDLSRPRSSISPPWKGEGFDRPAHFQQDGAFFDSHGRAIEGGKAAQSTPTQPTASQTTEAAPPPADPQRAAAIERLLIDSAGMAPTRFRSRAQQLLGHDSCPTEPREILAKLKSELGRLNAERVRVLEIERLIAESRVLPFGTLRRQAQVLLGETCPTTRGHAEIVHALEAALTIARGGQPAATPPRPTFRRLPSRKEHAGDGVDLAAWAAGRIEVPFARVREAIKAQRGVSVTSQAQAIALIKDEEVEAERVIPEDFPDS